MLHLESRQSGAQGHCALALAASIFLAIFIYACRGTLSAEEQAALEAQRLEQLYEAQAPEAQRLLQQIIAGSHDTIYADRMAHRYYTDSASWFWTASPRQQPLCDALDSLLRSQVKAMGFSDSAFCTASISRLVAEMHQPDSVANLPQTMAQLEHDLTKAYLRYAIGQRFGFTTPVRLFGERQYAVEIEQADSAFVHHALQQLSSKQTMLDFLASVEPADSAYHRLKQQLAADTTEQARQRTICNMERLRWRDKKHPEDSPRRIFVNIAAQQLWAIGPDSIANMRICCGKPSTKTPLLSSAINRIDVNPEWGIPQSIIRGEVSVHAGDSAYFARRRYYITDGTGQRIDPRDVTTQQLNSGRYAIRQRSGAGNSLGRIIFRFPNDFAVYLHDTSSPGAFASDVRTISHGCVRLQRPFDIAEFVLPDADEWKLDQMRLSMDLPPKSERGREYKRTHGGAIRLISSTAVEPSVPVMLSYFTCYPNPKTGTVETWNDPYGYDKILLKAIKPYLP